MKLHEREFFVSRIMSGLLKYEKDDLILFMHPLDAGQYYEAQEVFQKTYREALSEGIMTEEECLLMLVEHGLWNDEKQETMDGIEKDMETLKIEVFEAYFKESVKNAAKDLLNKAKIKYSELHDERHSYDFVTCLGVSTFARFNWIIENTTKHLDGSMCDWEEISMQDVLMHFQKSQIPEDDFRELARSEPWRTMWSTGKANGQLFDKPGVELTVEQRTLMAWSGLYDSVQESPEAPPDELIEDNDALDGWLLVQKRNRERDKAKEQAESQFSDKTMNADEVIVFGDRDKVSALNTPESKWTKAQRMKQLDEAGDKGVRYDKFDDMVQKRIIEQNQST